jgi:membrane dipeptidase
MIKLILIINLSVKLVNCKGSDVLNQVPLIDGHNDLAINIYTLENNQLKNFDLESNLKENPKWNIPKSYTDLPRLRSGKVGGQVWAAYVDCGRNYKDAVERTIEQIDIIKRFVQKYPKDFEFVTNADQIMQAFEEKKIASMIDVEGGHSIDSRLAVLRSYYELGVRCMTITHTCNVPWADASPIDDEPNAIKRNLTNWGKNVIREMNRLGMIVDIAHTSEGVMIEALETSKAPVIFSHADTYAVFPHHRNVKDHVLQKLKENKGIIMINFYSGYVGGKNTIYDVISEFSNLFQLYFNIKFFHRQIT